MTQLAIFIRNLFVRVPQELLVTVLRFLFHVVLLIPVLLLRLLEWLKELIKKRDLYPEETDEPCGRLPEGLVRRPDPCIYSQKLLMSQGVPVTWNNPDIWVAPASNPTAIEPDSYHLTADTDYIVTVRVHNASATDPAIGVRVRLVYRPWSFNSPDLLPVETDAIGNEVFRFVSVAPSSSAEVQFHWHTPPLAADETSKHFCLQARLFHPMDTNPNNNMGQENTNVHQADNRMLAAGETVRVRVPLHNPGRQRLMFHFAATRYEIEEEKIPLSLKTTIGRRQWRTSQMLANALPNLHSKAPPQTLVGEGFWQAGRLNFQTRPRVVAVRSRYVGYEAYKERLLSGDFSPHGFNLRVDDLPLEEGIEVDGRSIREVELQINVPDDVPPGTRVPLNFVALTDQDVPVGGVTIVLHV